MDLTPDELRALIKAAVAEALAESRRPKRAKKLVEEIEVTELDRAAARAAARRMGLIVKGE